jgi:hypothetical protein
MLKMGEETCLKKHDKGIFERDVRMRRFGSIAIAATPGVALDRAVARGAVF